MVYIVAYVNFHWLSIFLRLCMGTWRNDKSSESSCLVGERRRIVLVNGYSAVIRDRDLQYLYHF